MPLIPDSLPVGESLLVLIKEPLIVPYRRLLPQFRKSQTGRRGAGVEGKEGEKEGCIYNKLRQVCTCLNIFFSLPLRGEQINDSKGEHHECSSPFYHCLR